MNSIFTKLAAMLVFAFAGTLSSWAAQVTIRVGSGEGTFYRYGAAELNKNWASKWEKPGVLKLETNGNNMKAVNDTTINVATGNGNYLKYTLTAGDGWKISSYTIKMTPANDGQKVIIGGTEHSLAKGVQSSFSSAPDSTTAFFEKKGVNGDCTTLLDVTLETVSDGNTYVVSIGGNEYYGTETQTAGSAPTLPAALQRSFCTYEYFKDQAMTETCTAVEANTVVYVKATKADWMSDSYEAAKWKYLRVRDNNSYVSTDGTGNTIGAKQKKAVYQWAFVGDPYNGVAVYNRAVGAGKVLAADGTADGTAASMKDATAAVAKFYPRLSDKISGTQPIFFLSANSTAGPSLNKYAGGTVLKFWSGADAGSSFTIEDVPQYSVTYHVSIGSFTGQESVTAIEGEPKIPAVMVRDFCTYEYFSDEAHATPLATIEAAAQIYVKPVKADWMSDSYEAAKWYLWAIRTDNPSYLKAESAQTSLQGTKGYEDDMTWAFVGDPYNGLAVYNRSTGATKKLAAGAVTGDGGNTKAFMQEEGVEGQTYSWFPVLKAYSADAATKTNGTARFVLRQGSRDGQCLNKRATLAFWAGNADVGSICFVEQADFSENLRDGYSACFEDPDAGKPFHLSVAGKAALDSAYAANTSGFLGKAAYDSFVQQIKDNRQPLTTGTYLIVGRHRDSAGRYVYSRPSDNRLATCTKADYDENRDGIKDYAIATVTSRADGKYTLYFNGRSANVNEDYNQAIMPTDSAVAFIIQPNDQGVNNVKFYEASVKADNSDVYGLLHEAGSNIVVKWEAGSDASWWEFIPVSVDDTKNVSLGSAEEYSWSTAYKPYNFTLPEGVAAFTLNSAGTLSAVEGAVRGGVPVILRAPKDKGAIELTPGGEVTENRPADNVLKGTYSDLTVTSGEKYTLQRKGGSEGGAIGMMLFTGTTIPAGKAYVDKADVDGSPARSSFVDFESGGVPTGIGSAKAEAAADDVYDLQGRRVAAPKAGLYIVGGRKVVLK